MADNWGKTILEWKDFIIPPVSFAAGSIATKLYDGWKRVRFVSSDWKLWYVSQDSSGGVVYKENPPGFMFTYHFTSRFFNEKPVAIGLHRFSVLFTRGVLHNRQILIRDNDPRHGERQIRASQIYYEPLGQITLEPRDWAVENITGHSSDLAALEKADAAWFIAYTANGKKREWHIADLTPRS